MKKTIFLIYLMSTLSVDIVAQKEVRSFIFGHSLVHHEFQLNPTPSQETSVPHWVHFLAQSAGHNYAVGGQYGFLPQHANLPPIAQWGFDFVPGAWDSDNEPFSAADFTNVFITPGNFIQWQSPLNNYPGENLSPIDATIAMIDWCIQQEEDLQFYIYESWPDMAPYLGGEFPPNSEEWNNYNDYLLDDFHDWFVAYYNGMAALYPDACVRMIPVGPIISNLLQQTPYDQIPIDQLYEDDAPHGRASLYFLASLATYMTMYKEKAPASFQVDPLIHPIIADNYLAVVDFIWDQLLDYHGAEGGNSVFCSSNVVSVDNQLGRTFNLTLYPNPVHDQLMIKGDFAPHSVSIYDIHGREFLSFLPVRVENEVIDVSALPSGIYFAIGRNRAQEIYYRKKLIKH